MSKMEPAANITFNFTFTIPGATNTVAIPDVLKSELADVAVAAEKSSKQDSLHLGNLAFRGGRRHGGKLDWPEDDPAYEFDKWIRRRKEAIKSRVEALTFENILDAKIPDDWNNYTVQQKIRDAINSFTQAGGSDDEAKQLYGILEKKAQAAYNDMKNGAQAAQRADKSLSTADRIRAAAQKLKKNANDGIDDMCNKYTNQISSISTSTPAATPAATSIFDVAVDVVSSIFSIFG